MSRRPKPSIIRELEGNAGHRAFNKEEPKPEIGAPEMPKGMGICAKRHWRRYVHNLLKIGVLTTVDGPALEQACRSAALAEKYGNKVIESPTVNLPMFDDEGKIVAWKEVENPLLNAYLKCSKNMKAFQIEFGLTPASRVRLHVEKKVEEDALPTKEETTLPGDQIDLSAIDETVVN